MDGGGAAAAPERIPAPAQAGQAGTTSAFDRLVFFPKPQNNYVSFDYFVDSRPEVDFLNVYVDPQVNPAPVFAVSGPNQVGHVLIDKVEGAAIGGGPHLLRFEYARGTTSGGTGLDTARVDNVAVVSDGGPIDCTPSRGATWAPSRSASARAPPSGLGSAWAAAGWCSRRCRTRAACPGRRSARSRSPARRRTPSRWWIEC